jgi:hypothetical protein
MLSSDENDSGGNMPYAGSRVIHDADTHLIFVDLTGKGSSP